MLLFLASIRSTSNNNYGHTILVRRAGDTCSQMQLRPNEAGHVPKWVQAGMAATGMGHAQCYGTAQATIVYLQEQKCSKAPLSRAKHHQVPASSSHFCLEQLLCPCLGPNLASTSRAKAVLPEPAPSAQRQPCVDELSLLASLSPGFLGSALALLAIQSMIEFHSP